GDDGNVEQHVPVILAAQFGALTQVHAFLARGDGELVHHAGQDVLLVQEGRYPERVRDVAAAQRDLHGLVHGEVQGGQIVCRRHRAVQVRGVAGVPDVLVVVDEVPGPLAAVHGDVHVRFDVRVGDVLLDGGGVVEQHAHHHDRHEGVEQFQREVVAQLYRQAVVVLALAVHDHAPDDQAPHQ